MTTERVTTLLEAEDRASAKFAAAGGALQRAFGPAAMKATLLSLFSFSAIISSIGISVGLVTRSLMNYFKEVQAANRAVAKLSDQMRLAGFSTASITRRMDELRNSLTRAQLVALAGLDKGLREFFELLGPEAKEDVLDLAEALEELGVPAEEALKIATEAGAGNFVPLAEVLDVDPSKINSVVDGLEEANTQLATIIANRTPLETVWASIKDFGEWVRTVLIAQLNRWSERILGIVEDVKTLGAILLSVIDWANAMVDAGRAWAISLVTGLVEWIMGSTAVELIQLALEGNWALLWEKLQDIVIGWGKSIGGAFIEGWQALMDSDFVKWLDEHIWQPIVKFVTETIPRMWEFGKQLGLNLANGLIDMINAGINKVVDLINRWIETAIEAFNRLLPPGVPRIRTPHLSGINIGHLGADTAATAAGGVPTAAAAHVQAPVKVEINGKTLTAFVVDAFNGSIRILNPGLR